MKKTREQKAITLIALIITIVILLILAVVTINAIKNGQIIEYARQAKDDYNDKKDKEETQLQSYLDIINENDPNNEALNHRGVIPEGGVYYVEVIPDDSGSGQNWGDYTGAKAILKVGENFPSTTKRGDVYVYNNYEYRYNLAYCCCGSWFCCHETTDWGVHYNGNVSEPGPVLESIAGHPITSMTDTFNSCMDIKISPGIPNTVTDISCMFDTCYELTQAPIVPVSVTRANSSFYSNNIINTIKIPCHLREYAKEWNTNIEKVELYHYEGCGHNLNATIIPTGAIYKKADGGILYAGDEFPSIGDGDIYKYGDYEYCYGYGWCTGCEEWSHLCGCEYGPCR